MKPKMYFDNIQPTTEQRELVTSPKKEEDELLNAKTGQKFGHPWLVNAINREPGVRPVLRKLADKVARGVALPTRFSVGELGYAAQRELEGLLGVVGKRMPDWRVSFPLLGELRDPLAWQKAIAFFGLARGDDAEGEDVFGRLKLLLPETAWILDLLAGRDDVSRYGT